MTRKKPAPVSGRILIVDDNRVNKMTLTRALAQQGHTSATADNGRQAIEMLTAEPFDVVLLDILMPEMDGYETLERIKQNPDWQHISVIMISAVDEMNSVIPASRWAQPTTCPSPSTPLC